MPYILPHIAGDTEGDGGSPLNTLDWQDSVKDRHLTAPPGAPANGDRYLIGGSATGAWATHDYQITQYVTDTWVFVSLSEGQATWVEDENLVYYYDGSTWTAPTNQPAGASDWKDAVADKDLSAPPSTPATGDRYIVGASATGAWAGQENALAEYNGAGWDFTAAAYSYITFIQDESAIYFFNGTAWEQVVIYAVAHDHGGHFGLLDDDHPQYILVAGTRAFTGNQSMGGYKLTSLATCTDGTDAANKAYVDAMIVGLDWQESVKDKDLLTPPGAPTTGDRYIINGTGTGAWATHDKQITEWNGASWDFTTLSEGQTAWVEDENVIYSYNGTDWVAIGAVIDHGGLPGLSDDDHAQYILVAGTRAFTGAQSMGGFRLTNLAWPTDDNDAIPKKYVDWMFGINYQEPVESYTYSTPTTTPGFPISLEIGDRYIVKPTGADAWAGLNNYIVEYNGGATPASNAAAWDQTAPVEGMVSLVIDENAFYYYNGTTWVKITTGGGGGGGVIDHGALRGLGDDDHLQYILVAGTRAFTGNQSMGGFKLTSLGVPTALTDAASKGYVDGMEHQNSVIDKDVLGAPAAPANGARYLINGVGISGAGGDDFIGQDYKIATYYTVGGWTFISPTEGMICWVDDENLHYAYTGAAWQCQAATATEINTGTELTKWISPGTFQTSNRNIRYVNYRAVAPATDVANGSTLGGDFECPITGTLLTIGAYVDTAGVTGTMVLDVHKGGVTVMASTKISIETGEKSSRDATTQPVITVTAVTAGDIFTFDCDTEHSGTKAKGLSFRLAIRET